MLFGTYQRIFDFGSEAPKNLLNPNRCYNNKLGFSPLWAFPVNDLQSLVAHSLCSAPNFPDIFYLIETDDYVRVNKILHYQMISKGGYKCKREEIDYTSVIDDEADDDHLEFLLNPDLIKFENIRCMSAVGNAQEDAFAQLMMVTPPLLNDPNMIKEVAHVIDYFARTIPKIDQEKASQSLLEAGYSKEYSEFEGAQRSRKFIFEMSMLPYIYAGYVSRDQEIMAYRLGAVSRNAGKIMRLVNDFARWSYGDCDKNEYDRIFNGLKSLVITDEAILKCTTGNKKIYPNEPCPCGSGKKYKVCHGRN